MCIVLFCFSYMQFLWLQVIDLGGEPIKSTDYSHIGRVTEFKYILWIMQVSLWTVLINTHYLL